MERPPNAHGDGSETPSPATAPEKAQYGSWLKSNRFWPREKISEDYQPPKPTRHQYGLPRRVNHASALRAGSSEMFILGGFHQFNEYASYQDAGKLDCYRFDCLTQKTYCVMKEENIEQEIQDLNERDNQTADLRQSRSLDYPLMRYGLQACLLEDDKIYIYGGVADCPSVRPGMVWVNFNDVFELDLAPTRTNSSTKPTYKNLTQTSYMDYFNNISQEVFPGIRDGHSMSPIDGAQCFIIFGGYQHFEENFANDLWLFSTRQKKWYKIVLAKKRRQNLRSNEPARFPGLGVATPYEPENNPEPSARDFSTLTVVDNTLVLYGGRSFSESDIMTQNDTQSIYDPAIWIISDLFETLGSGSDEEITEFLKVAETRCWEAVAPADVEDTLSYPTPRRSHMAFIRKGEVYVTGGVDKNDIHHSDIWRFSLKSKTWHKVITSTVDRPHPRRRGTCIWYEKYDLLFLICGTRLPVNKSETDWIDKWRREISLPEHNKDKDSKDILLEVDDFSIFSFNTSLQQHALKSLIKSIDGGTLSPQTVFRVLDETALLTSKPETDILFNRDLTNLDFLRPKSRKNSTNVSLFEKKTS